MKKLAEYILKYSLFIINYYLFLIYIFGILINCKNKIYIQNFLFKNILNSLWGLGIGDWAQSPIPNPQSP
jgi:hypothetical protein